MKFFYDRVNTVENYTVIKHYANWCRHCKKLAPIYEELAAKFAEEGRDNVNFLQVNCGSFGSLCKGMRGYPMVQVIKRRFRPEKGVFDGIMEKPYYKRLWIWARYQFKNPEWKVEENRSTLFEGKRTLENLYNFIDTSIEKNELLGRVIDILDENYVCTDKLCEEGRFYYQTAILPITSGNSDQYKLLDEERNKLEEIEDLDDSTKKLLSRIISYFEDQLPELTEPQLKADEL